jgi:hypothetical protein
LEALDDLLRLLYAPFDIINSRRPVDGITDSNCIGQKIFLAAVLTSVRFLAKYPPLAVSVIAEKEISVGNVASSFVSFAL